MARPRGRAAPLTREVALAQTPLVQPHSLMFQNIPRIELSCTGPTTFLLQIRMSGSGSSGSVTMLLGHDLVALLGRGHLARLSSRFVSTISSCVSSSGTLVRVQFLPELPFAGPGMFFVQNCVQRPGDEAGQTAARTALRRSCPSAGPAEQVVGSSGS